MTEGTTRRFLDFIGSDRLSEAISGEEIEDLDVVRDKKPKGAEPPAADAKAVAKAIAPDLRGLLTNHLRADWFAGYVTLLSCGVCERSVEVPYLVPGLDAEYTKIRSTFVKKRQKCAPAVSGKRGHPQSRRRLMKRSDAIGLSFFTIALISLEFVARGRRTELWGCLLVFAWLVTLAMLIVGRVGGRRKL